MTPLSRIPGFLPFVVMVFLNAFVDLGHKIIIQNTVFKTYDGGEQIVLTAVVNALILLPFVLLFTPSGFISDRFAKHRVMRVSGLGGGRARPSRSRCSITWAGSGRPLP